MIALDTNVLIYACDRSNLERQQTASQLIERTTDGVLLWQVACEFVAASRKLSGQGFTAAGVEILYSEDVPGLALGVLKVINPFA